MLCLMAGCTHTSRHPQLVAVDSLLASQPDSALALLRQQLPSFGGTDGGSSTADRMYYYLLLADACNKCYDTLPSDSVMHLVADFYDAHGTPNEQVRAHYLLGCVYRDLGEAPQALDCYHTALDRADTTSKDCNYRQLCLIHGQCSNLFLNQDAPQMALESLKEAERYAMMAKDTLTALICYERRSIAYASMGIRDSAISVNFNASKKYSTLGYPMNAMMARSANILYLLEKEQYSDAKLIMDAYERDTSFFDNNGNIRQGLEKYYYEKGIYYLHINKIDSAEVCFRKELRLAKDFNNREAATDGLYKLYTLLGKSDSIAKYARLCYMYCDSASQLRNTELITRMQAMYQYERYKSQAKKSAEESLKTRRMLFVSALFIILLIGFLFFYYRYTVKREKKLYLRLVAFEKNKTLRELNDMEVNLQNSSIVGVFRENARHAVIPLIGQWQELFSLAHQLTPSFMSVIEDTNNGLRIEEQQICLLVRLRFTPKEISVLTSMSLSAISNIRKRLLSRLFKIEKGSSKDFDKLLLDIH